jgi:hypothetical protein
MRVRVAGNIREKNGEGVGGEKILEKTYSPPPSSYEGEGEGEGGGGGKY